MKKKKKQKKKLVTKKLPNKYLLKMRLIPYLRGSAGTIWLASLATGKSTRQINDWMEKRGKRTCVKRLGQNLTGKLTLHFYRTVINTLRQWCEELVPGDMIAFKCESADPDKQYRVWGKWLTRKDAQYQWKGNPELKCYTFYKQRYVE